MDMASECFSVKAMVYKDMWEASVGEELEEHCERELGIVKILSLLQPSAGQQLRSVMFRKKILSVCSIFLRRGGAIKCEVTASKCYLDDLPLGGLEILCTLKFKSPAKDSLNSW